MSSTSRVPAAGSSAERGSGGTGELSAVAVELLASCRVRCLAERSIALAELETAGFVHVRKGLDGRLLMVEPTERGREGIERLETEAREQLWLAIQKATGKEAGNADR
jgi:hypothetical protein